jgi:hypothetical protein
MRPCQIGAAGSNTPSPQAAGLWQTSSMLCPSGPMTKAA